MEITYDSSKRQRNIETHEGLDFADLDGDFFRAATVVPAKAGRFMAVGLFRAQAVAVVFKPLGTEGISIISMRAASRKERKLL